MFENMKRWLKLKQTTPAEQTISGRPQTSGYQTFNHLYFQQPRDLPLFSFMSIYAMLIDPQVRLALLIRSAPLFGVEWAFKKTDPTSPKGFKWMPGIQSERPEVAVFIQRQLERIWNNHLHEIVEAQKWGWMGGEVCLKLGRSRLVEFKRLEVRRAEDLRLLKTRGIPSGIEVRRVKDLGNVNLAFPEAFFHSHDRQPGEDYGQSAMLGAYSPWCDKWLDGAALDVRRLFMHKDAYGGADLGYPDGETYIHGFDQPVPNRDVARQIVEQIRAGNTIVRPSARDANGNEQWPLERATVAANPAHILQYPKDLDSEITSGIGIPNQVLDNAGSQAGARVPMAAFYASLDSWVTQIVSDLKEQVFEHLVLLNWGRPIDFEITHKPLAEQAMEQQSNSGGQPVQPGSGQGNGLEAGGQDAQSGIFANQPPPRRMSLDVVSAVGQGVLSATELVKAARQCMSLDAGQAVQPTKPEYDFLPLAVAFLDQAEQAEQNTKRMSSMVAANPISPPVNVTINMPPGPAPEVTVNNQVDSPIINLPTQDAPTINVVASTVSPIINIPQQSPPTINIRTPKADAPTINITTEPAKPVATKTTIIRDSRGDIIESISTPIKE